MDKGTLFIVSTPIGNLGDTTYRAVEILGGVHVIAAEDTRRTRILLRRYDVSTPVSSYNSYNKAGKGRYFIDLLTAGHDVALVSDAGTPGISDPLYHLVREAVEAGIAVCSVPGPSAVIAALTVSGLPVDRFVFEGFLPRKKGRSRRLEELAAETRTLVIYESPLRLSKTLVDLYRNMGNRKIAIAREMTKIHEEVIRGDLETLSTKSVGKKWKGEITLVIQGLSSRKKES